MLSFNWIGYFSFTNNSVRIAYDEGSNGSYNEFCKDTLTWLEEDVFCAGAPKATVDSFEDDEIVSSFSKFNQLMEKLKETKMSDLSDFDDKHDEGDHAATNSEDTKKVEDFKKTQTNSSSDNTSNSSSADQVKCLKYNQQIFILDFSSYSCAYWTILSLW